ncbi:flavin reductase family protein [Mycolicibacterium palauense]|uniref:flavin reductase family protein n=1 Tax=Mycolicibacterium palauense TaxID=2034511 RepID=UPI000BFED5D5|nr:flavin reductase family protein [Mycolicibacterium palauense]
MAGKDAHFYRTADGTGLPHDPFNAIVGPRPIGWVSTLGGDGIPNLAPYSFFNGFNYHPPLIGFASVGWKDSVANIDATREFVWNLVTRDLAEAMNETSASIPASENEFERAGLTAVPSELISAPRVLESPVNFECVLTQLVALTDVDGHEVGSWLVLGQVVAVHIDRHLLVDGVYDTTAPTPVLRTGGPAGYVAITRDAVFTMVRPDDRPRGRR